MRNRVSILMALAFLLVALSTVAFAGKNAGPCEDCTPLHEVIDSFTYEDVEVVTYPVEGGGIEVAVDSQNIVIYGLGPSWYWDGIDKPNVGELIDITGYIVDYNGVERYIATSITVGEETIELRDEDGHPLWRGAQSKQYGQQ
jgi:hypothetical protein